SSVTLPTDLSSAAARFGTRLYTTARPAPSRGISGDMPCILFIFAHPDDESFTAAGTALACRERGIRPVLVTATRGGRGKRGAPPVCAAEEIAACREEELRAAAAIIGIDGLHLLDYRDRELADAPPAEIRRSLVAIIRRERPDVAVSFDPNGFNAH